MPLTIETSITLRDWQILSPGSPYREVVAGHGMEERESI
jgi:hypothetical protein